MAKNPTERWPTAAALAAVARQAATMLATPSPPHPAPSASPVPPIRPPGTTPATVAQAAVPSGGGFRPTNVQTVQSGPPYPPVLQPPPVAPVTPAYHGPISPPGWQGAGTGYGYAHPATVERDTSGNRSLLIALAVVLGVLLVLCAGVIVSLLKNRDSTAAPAGPAAPIIAVAHQLSAERDVSGKAPYRQVEPLRTCCQGDNPMSEGRKTR
jgi:hypothetical protein